ncbi:Histidine ammonia-lyase [Streptomyces alboniger]
MPTEAATEHGLRLLRSHAGAIGEELPAREVRAMLAVRANQLLAGGAGLRPSVVTALCEALESGAHPVVNEFGSVGTGDIAALAQAGLALAGEHPWRGAGAPEPQSLDNNDALAFISSNALTLGQSALALHELRGLLEATQVVGALSLLAVDGSHEAYAAPVHAARPHRGSSEVARRMRTLIGAADRPTPPLGRLQDPYGFRCLPQVHGPAHDAADALEEVLAIEINAAAENPLICPEDLAAYHHGGFYQAQLALALDHFRLAMTQVARLSTSRLASLNRARLHPAAALPRRSGARLLRRDDPGVRRRRGPSATCGPSPRPPPSGTLYSPEASRNRPASPRSPHARHCARAVRTGSSSAANSSPPYGRCVSAASSPSPGSRWATRWNSPSRCSTRTRPTGRSRTT